MPENNRPSQSPNGDVIFSERPALRNPIMIMAFEGWNDAAEGATEALEYLQESWEATRFAEIDPEEFYDFTEVRPMVQLVNRNQRKIDWPANEFFFHRDRVRDRDYILLLGIEPSLRWRRFTKAIIDVARQFEVSSLISLGALLSDVPHGRQARVSVTATDEKLLARLGRQAGRGSRYEGPTGIVGVLQDAFQQAGIRGASLWGHAPHYLSASPNPMVSLGILRRLDSLLDLDLDLHELEKEADTFVAQVNEAVAQDPEATSYIHMLEAQSEDEKDEEESEDDSPRRPRNTGKGLIQDVEEFLRRRRASDE